MIREQHILVVEDFDEDFDTVKDAARRASMRHPIVRATSGGEALRMLRSAAGDNCALPLLLLLDLNTPGEDGREVLREIRSSPDLSTLPVIVLSGSANPHDLNFCYANGANAYHVKPMNYAKHLQTVQQVFAYWLAGVQLPLPA
ncbi:MAG: response regulator [Rhodoferax sp.]|nr:response regulator [Rhodoferax sp.]